MARDHSAGFQRWETGVRMKKKRRMRTSWWWVTVTSVDIAHIRVDWICRVGTGESGVKICEAARERR